MMDANELFKITQEAIEEIRREIIKEATLALENEIAPKMLRVAKEGGFMTTYRVAPEISIDYIFNVLKSLGYSVKRDGKSLTISWG